MSGRSALRAVVCLVFGEWVAARVFRVEARAVTEGGSRRR
jgi:hypothetical protein